MGGIFGVVDFGRPALAACDVDGLSTAMTGWAEREARHVALGGACFGRVDTSGRRHDPETAIPTRCRAGTVLFTAESRLDNREELCAALDIASTDRIAFSDDALVLAAYGRWGEACAERLLGDWSFAAWHPAERRLVLGRDQTGNGSLYYAYDGDQLAFASHSRALLSLAWVPRRLNETRLARLLVLDLRPDPEDGSCTIYRDVHLLLPAHTLDVTPQHRRRRCYWQSAPSPREQAWSDAAYAEAFLDCLRGSVRCRLGGGESVGAMLSAGLDSTSIAVLAAQELARRGQRLTAFTSVPAVADPWPTAPGHFANEGPRAALVARSVSNMDHVLLDSRAVSPLAALRDMLRIIGEPTIGGVHSYWLVDLLSQAAQGGVGVVFRGSLGNHTMSWRGPRETGSPRCDVDDSDGPHAWSSVRSWALA